MACNRFVGSFWDGAILHLNKSDGLGLCLDPSLSSPASLAVSLQCVTRTVEGFNLAGLPGQLTVVSARSPEDISANQRVGQEALACCATTWPRPSSPQPCPCPPGKETYLNHLGITT
ncbi:unnamed protein product [Leuciscus chuanchicus]